MKLLNCASVLTAVALLSSHPIVAVEAAETAKAVLKDAKGEDVGSVSLMQTSAGVLLRLSLKVCRQEIMPYTSMPWASASHPGLTRQAGISIRQTCTTGSCRALGTPAICRTYTFRQMVHSISKCSMPR